MKKSIIIMLAAVLCGSCSNSVLLEEDLMSTNAAETIYTPEEEECLQSVYNYCVTRWGDEIPQNLLDDRIETIRYCEITFDIHGDNLCEMTEYIIIEHIIWPNGFGNI